MKLGNIRQLFGVLCVCALGTSAAQAAMYQVSVDTSSLAGSNGYLDLQLNPADVSAPTATAAISNLQGSLTLLAAADVAGGAGGALPGVVSLNNSSAFNDYFQSVQFGNVFSVILDINGDFLTQPSLLGTSFALSLYAADGINPLLSTDASGALVIFALANQAITFQTFADTNGTHAAQVAPVPLPAGVWLLLSGLLGIARLTRKR
jgi:hypothetical protein